MECKDGPLSVEHVEEHLRLLEKEGFTTCTKDGVWSLTEKGKALAPNEIADLMSEKY